MPKDYGTLEYSTFGRFGPHLTPDTNGKFFMLGISALMVSIVCWWAVISDFRTKKKQQNKTLHTKH